MDDRFVYLCDILSIFDDLATSKQGKTAIWLKWQIGSKSKNESKNLGKKKGFHRLYNMLLNLTTIISKVGDDLDVAHLGSVMAKCLTDLTELFTFYIHRKKIHAWEIYRSRNHCFPWKVSFQPYKLKEWIGGNANGFWILNIRITCFILDKSDRWKSWASWNGFKFSSSIPVNKPL